MKNDLPAHRDLFSGGADASGEVEIDGVNAPERFWSCHVQTFNWGTFSGVHHFPIARRRHLFVGPSGAGKSTALDAHAALTTPPLWLNFNVAARETERGGGVDRNAMSYVRGAWAEQTGDSGEVAAQYLRPATTWSVIAETFANGRGDRVSLVQLLFIRGASTAASDLKKLYLVFKRDVDVQEFKIFAESDFDVRKLKAGFDDAWIGDKFSGYQERFRGLLGIDSEAALKLLHKTQSAKNLGDLNAFLRDFMLDVPETFGIADDLVKEFGDLNDAHQSLVEAGRQIDTLEPARVENEELSRSSAQSLHLDTVRDAIDPYREQTRHQLLGQAVKALALQIEGAQGDMAGLKSQAAAELLKLTELRSRRAGMGGALIADLEQQRHEAGAEREARVLRRRRTEAACLAMGWTAPTSASAMVNLIDQARAALAADAANATKLADERFDLRRKQEDAAAGFKRLRDEITAMERQPSNIPHAMLRLRDALCMAVGAPADKLPFAGELMQVKSSEALWQGAAERVLRGFALSLVVDERWYERVSRWVNDTHLGARLVYLRALPPRAGSGAPGATSLVRKVDVAAGELAEWVLEELKARFDYECITDLAALRTASRAAVTPQGLVKHNSTRHEKDDRSAVGDRRNWVLGFDNAAKLQLFRADAQRVADEIAALQTRLATLEDGDARDRAKMQHCQALVNQNWADVDVAAMVRKVEDLALRIQAEQEAHPNLKVLDGEIARQEAVHRFAEHKGASLQAQVDQWSTARREHEATQAQAPSHLLAAQLPALLRNDIDTRFAATGKLPTLRNLDELTRSVERSLSDERSTVQRRLDALKSSIERRLADFVRVWPAESAGLDARIESTPDFLAKLHRLKADRLPEFRERFMELLTRQSDQNLTRLSHQLETERNAIRERLETVNESLRGAQFNPGTYLTIESSDKMLEPVRAFRAELKAAHTGSLSSDTALAEARFLALKVLVKRLASQDAAEQRWRALVLDVRQHIDFIARERDEAGVEVEVYRSGAGKSGGQRQKLAATCLAAALRYQLGGIDGAFPTYSTVVLDEAFDKADPKFTALAMNIFVQFGFQMIVATPMRSVMALEPFIGGATYVSIKDRKHSQARQIEYDESQSRLQLSDAQLGGDERRADARA